MSSDFAVEMKSGSKSLGKAVSVPNMPLKRTLGLTMLTFYGTGMILGAGIYSIIGQAAGIAGDAVWQGFALAAIAALLTALSYAELAALFPKTGGEYVYLRQAFPRARWVAATTGMLVIFAGCSSAATVALAFSSYFQHFMPAPRFLVASGLLISFSAVNIFGIQQSSWMNAIFTLIEAAGLVLFIWLGLQSPTFGDAISEAPNMEVVSSAALIIFAFFGFENIVNLADETKDPEKTIPRAIFLSLSVSTVLYILVSLAAVALMPSEQLALSDSAIADAAMNHSPPIAKALGVIALFSIANTALIALITTSRIVYGISKDKSLPRVFSNTLTKRKTPWVAAISVCGISILLLQIGNVGTLASVSAFVTMVAFVAVNIAAIVLRLTSPGLSRPFRVPLSIHRVPVIPTLGIVICLILISQFGSEVAIIGFAAMALAFAAHRINDRIGQNSH